MADDIEKIAAALTDGVFVKALTDNDIRLR
jgi:hypothetical protein